MKIIKFILILLFVAIVVVFSFQNFESIFISFLGWQVNLPVFAAVIIIYILGAVTGGLLLSMIKKITTTEKKN